MRLVFTKLSTPLNSIEIDYGDGEGFKPVQPQDLTQSGDGWYIPLEDNTEARSIRVRTSSEELDNFKMIKDYQIKDNDGNWVGGNINQTLTFPIDLFTYYDPSYYYGEVTFPYKITEAGKHIALICSEGQIPYFQPITITRIDTEVNGFYAVYYDGEEETLFEIVRQRQ